MFEVESTETEIALGALIIVEEFSIHPFSSVNISE